MFITTCVYAGYCTYIGGKYYCFQDDVFGTDEINWDAIIGSEIQTGGVNWDSVIQAEIQTEGINWESVINDEVYTHGLNWDSIPNYEDGKTLKARPSLGGGVNWE